MKTTLISLISVICASSVLLGGCGFIRINYPSRDTSPTDGTETQPSDNSGSGYTIVDPDDEYESRRAAVEVLPSADLGGISVIIASSEAQRISPENASTPYDAAVIKRNALVEEKYNTSIVSINADADEILRRAQEAEKDGTQYADLICIPMNRIGEFLQKDLIIGMQSLPYADYDEVGFNASAISQSSAAYDIFAVTGDANISADYAYVVLFNKDMAEELGLGNVYSHVYGGDWTWELFATMTNTAVANGHGGFTAYASDSALAGITMASTGGSFVKTEFGAIPERNEPTETLAVACDTIGGLLRSKSFSGTLLGGPHAGNIDAFRAGETLFCIAKINDLSLLSGMQGSFGVLPMPKLHAEQESYYTHIDSSIPVFAVLRSCTSIENASLVLNALNAASGYYLREGYYNELLTDHLCDTDSLSMLDRAYDGAVLDFVYLFGTQYPRIAQGSYEALFSAMSGGTTLDRAYSSTATAFRRQISSLFKLRG